MMYECAGETRAGWPPDGNCERLASEMCPRNTSTSLGYGNGDMIDDHDHGSCEEALLFATGRQFANFWRLINIRSGTVDAK